MGNVELQYQEIPAEASVQYMDIYCLEDS